MPHEYKSPSRQICEEITSTHDDVKREYTQDYTLEGMCVTLADEVEALRASIRQTLDDNRHLADGTNCTLIELKRALERSGCPWDGVG